MGKPPFLITNKMNNLVSKISEKVGILQERGIYQKNLHLRKDSRIRSIRGTTAIEGNILTNEQITDIISGKTVLGNPIEIKEIKNAYQVYENIQKFNPYNIEDFLYAHKILTNELIKNSGRFRDGNVGVYDGENLVHMGANPKFVPTLMRDLFKWLENEDIHPLIKSSIAHYGIEFIHPFDDGNRKNWKVMASCNFI